MWEAPGHRHYITDRAVEIITDLKSNCKVYCSALHHQQPGLPCPGKAMNNAEKRTELAFDSIVHSGGKENQYFGTDQSGAGE